MNSEKIPVWAILRKMSKTCDTMEDESFLKIVEQHIVCGTWSFTKHNQHLHKFGFVNRRWSAWNITKLTHPQKEFSSTIIRNSLLFKGIYYSRSPLGKIYQVLV